MIVNRHYELYVSNKVLDTYGDFEQTVVNYMYVAVLRYRIPMVILNMQL